MDEQTNILYVGLKMLKNKMELIFTKPTQHFYNFLCQQGRHQHTIDKKYLNVDQTGYFIDRYSNIEQSVTEVEQHYQLIFLYECRRWLGRHFSFTAKPSLLEFSDCFQLLVHQNVYFYNQDKKSGPLCGLLIRPTAMLLEWLKVNTLLEGNLLDSWKDINLADNASVLLLRFEQLDEVLSFVNTHYLELAQLEQKRLGLPCFPKLYSFKSFSRFFNISIHQHIKFLTENTTKL